MTSTTEQLLPRGYVFMMPKAKDDVAKPRNQTFGGTEVDPGIKPPGRPAQFMAEATNVRRNEQKHDI